MINDKEVEKTRNSEGTIDYYFTMDLTLKGKIQGLNPILTYGLIGEN